MEVCFSRLRDEYSEIKNFMICMTGVVYDLESW